MSDQWLEPYVIVGEDSKPVGAVEDGDSVLIFNFRAGAAAEPSPEIEMREMAQLRMMSLTAMMACFTSLSCSFSSAAPYSCGRHSHLFTFRRPGGHSSIVTCK